MFAFVGAYTVFRVVCPLRRPLNYSQSFFFRNTVRAWKLLNKLFVEFMTTRVPTDLYKRKFFFPTVVPVRQSGCWTRKKNVPIEYTVYTNMGRGVTLVYRRARNVVV